MQKIKKGDQVIVISGREKGKKGKVLKVDIKNNKLLIENINIVKKHQKPNEKNRYGGIVKMPAFLLRDKVQLICPNCNKPTRVGIKIEKNKKYRFCKKCKKIIK